MKPWNQCRRAMELVAVGSIQTLTKIDFTLNLDILKKGIKMLKCSKRTLFEVSHKNLERFLLETYGLDFDYIELMEFGDVHLFHVTSNLDRYDLAAAEHIRKGKREGAYMTTMLNVLCLDGFIEAGDYLVIVREQ